MYRTIPGRIPKEGLPSGFQTPYGELFILKQANHYPIILWVNIYGQAAVLRSYNGSNSWIMLTNNSA